MPKQDCKVLIVDDFGNTAKVLSEMFSHLHVNTDAAETPEEAFIKLKARKYELVIADSRMPKVDGVSLLKEIRSSNPTTKVAVMSTFDSGQTHKMVVADGIDYYLPKPVKLIHIQQMLDKLSLNL